MSLSSPGEITLLLSKAKNPEALAKLMPLVYDELRQIAVHYFRPERRGHTLQPTALLHEAYLRLLAPRSGGYQNRAHFFGAASRAMRRVLVDYARRKRAKRRGGDWQRVELESVQTGCREDMTDFLALDEALKRLEAFDPPLSQIVELRFFARLTAEETAALLRMGESTVRRRWTFAKAWLQRELEDTAR